MKSIEIVGNGIYLPKTLIQNSYYNEKFGLDETWIEKRTGIKTRYYAKEETIDQMAINAVKDAIERNKIDVQKIGIIVVATTSTKRLMPGISYLIQKELDIKNCMCLDILAGCSGYINSFDLVKKYLITEDIEYGLIVGVEKLSEYIDEKDVNTAVILGDGAGATIVKSTRCR